MQTGLSGKVVIVTAATANIGRGIALAFAAEGARVVITGRDQGDADVLWRPADMTGAAAVYLASEAAAFVTGHTLQVDGGVSLV